MGQPEYFDTPLNTDTIRRLADEEFGDMVKFVVDLERHVMCAGGGLHSDEEALLLERGSSQSDLWGANYFLERPAGKRLAYTSMINIRPRDGNTQQEIKSPELRQRVADAARHFFGTI